MGDGGRIDDQGESAFAGHLVPGRRPALLIVDMVMAYLDPASPLWLEGEAAVACAARLAAVARRAGAPVVFTAVRYQRGGLDGGLFYRKVPALRLFDEGSSLAAFPPSLQPAPGDLVVTKQYASAFFGTTLASTLQVAGIDTLLVAGFSTSGCVRASTVDALQHGFAPFVVETACADHRFDAHAANLADLGRKYAELVDESHAAAILAPP